MKTLYMFTKSPWARRDMENWLERVDEGDAVLLVQDAVLAARTASAPTLDAMKKLQGRVFALKSDLRARGIEPGFSKPLDDAQAVKLFFEYDRVAAI